jgi:ligand-binding SRPBCC domain-containing protein
MPISSTRRYELRCAMQLPQPLAEVFAIFEEPRNLARITPPWLHFEIVTDEPLVMHRGLLIDYVIRWMAIPMRWRTEITAYEPPSHFVDEQLRGPYRLWRHTHRFTELPEGVQVADCVEYELPLGPLGTLVHAMLVRRQLLAIFRYRQQAIARHFGVDLQEVEAPAIRRVR